jgi:hypothetical protein
MSDVLGVVTVVIGIVFLLVMMNVGAQHGSFKIRTERSRAVVDWHATLLAERRGDSVPPDRHNPEELAC